MARVVVLDANATSYRVIKHLIGSAHQVDHYEHALLALEYVREHTPDVVFVNVDQEGCDPFDLISQINLHLYRSPVVAIVDEIDVEQIVEAVQRGACAVVSRPFSPKELERAITRALARRQIVFGKNVLPGAPEIVGMSDATIHLRNEITTLAASMAPVVITGESGVGKDLVAHALHQHSPVVHGPFEERNCGAIPQSLIESELFGTERGAYTDATHRVGAFGLANDGSIFLDEVGELSAAAQAVMLRVIDNGTYHAVGGTSLIRSNARVIAATNRDLRELVAAGVFRKDLFYRLSILHIHVPPLRDRRDDIPLLVRHFDRLLRNKGVTTVAEGFGADTLQLLSEYEWPGNVRELKAVVWRALIAAHEQTIRPDDVSFY